MREKIKRRGKETWRIYEWMSVSKRKEGSGSGIDLARAESELFIGQKYT